MIRSMERTSGGIKRLGKAWHGNFMRPVSGRITCPFGMRFHPISGRYELHTGVDIACPIGTPVHAAAGGVVIVARWNTAYGNMVIIDHGGGVTTLYGHNSRLAVSAGQTIRQGQIIAYSGSTGWSTGPHCHFQVNKHGTPVNPL
jgi:murein DD-endopeptidase MepM/ murein hydrolase activator NlpD